MQINSHFTRYLNVCGASTLTLCYMLQCSWLTKVSDYSDRWLNSGHYSTQNFVATQSSRKKHVQQLRKCKLSVLEDWQVVCVCKSQVRVTDDQSRSSVRSSRHHPYPSSSRTSQTGSTCSVGQRSHRYLFTALSSSFISPLPFLTQNAA